MDNQIDSAIRVGRGYWFVDGFTEMLAGGLFVLLGGVMLLRGMAPQGSFVAQFASIASDIGFIKVLGLLAAGLILWWVKDRFTYPRTGFVRGKRVTVTQMLTFIRNAVLCLLLPVLGLVAAFFFLPSMGAILFSMPAWSPAFLGAILAVLCILSGHWMGLHRFGLLGVLILLTGIGISAWQLAAGLPPIPVEALQSSPLAALPEVLRAPLADILNRTFISIGLLTQVSGAVFATSGVVTFLRYRKENPAPYREEV
jgi:hypothetical protein